MSDAREPLQIALDPELVRVMVEEIGHLGIALDEFDQAKQKGPGSTEFLTARSNVVIRARVLVDRCRKGPR